MSTEVFQENPHRRFNPLRGEWILVSPHRGKRPWLGAKEKPAEDGRPAYDPNCYLCPGNTRATGDGNPTYTSTYVFRNDFSALLPEGSAGEGSTDELLRWEPVQGECRVICFSPRHDLTFQHTYIRDGDICEFIFASATNSTYAI